VIVAFRDYGLASRNDCVCLLERDLCQLLGQHRNRNPDVIPARAHRPCGNRVGEAGWIPNLRCLQNGIYAAIEAAYGVFEGRDHALDPRCRRPIVLELRLLSHLVPRETSCEARTNASWMIPAFGVCCLEMVLVCHGFAPVCYI
jgi:hypothetical protein